MVTKKASLSASEGNGVCIASSGSGVIPDFSGGTGFGLPHARSSRRTSVLLDTGRLSPPLDWKCSQFGLTPKLGTKESRCAKKAQERRIVANWKPFVGNPAGNQSRPAELGQQPEASLAWGG